MRRRIPFEFMEKLLSSSVHIENGELVVRATIEIETRIPLGVNRRVTRRQSEVLPLIVKGLSNKEIAAQLNVCERTVKFHVGELLTRFRCTTRSELQAIVTVVQ
jgi:DNA-binding NarL/FixJ family response regulator